MDADPARCFSSHPGDAGGAGAIYQSSGHAADVDRQGGRDVLERAQASPPLPLDRSAADSGDVPGAPLDFGRSAILPARWFRLEGDGHRDEKSGAKRETGSRSVHDHEPMRPVDLPLAGTFLDQERTGVVLHDLDGGAVAEAAHPGVIRKRDRDGARDLWGRSGLTALFRRQRARSNERAVCNAGGGLAESERLGSDETRHYVTMASAAHSAT